MAIKKPRGRPSVDGELKKDKMLTLRLNDVQLEALEEVRRFLEETQHLRVKFVKNKITLRDALTYLMIHGMTYYNQDRRRKAEKE